MNLSIKEKFAGMLFGYAIGDALGLGTEFMSKKEVKQRYPDGLHDYSQIIRDAHRSQWERGEWSNDTETILLLLECIIADKGIDFIHYAHKLKEWYMTGPSDITTNLRLTLSQPDFGSKPFETTRRVWSAKNRMDTTSECLGRALVVSIWNNDTLNNVLQVCRLTHPDTRCETSCLIIARMAHSLFWEDRVASYGELVDIALEHNKKEMLRYLEMAHHGSLAEMQLDDDDSYWFVRKALSAALWATWHTNSVEEGINTIIAQGGDADTNACLAGALLGIKFGYSSIPQHLIYGLVDKEKLEKIAEKFISLLTEKFC